jgi:hypothetical protein
MNYNTGIEEKNILLVTWDHGSPFGIFQVSNHPASTMVWMAYQSEVE